MKMRSVCTGQACMTSEGQLGSGQTDELTEGVVGCIPVGNDKEVMITQIVDMSLQDNKDDELGGSMPSSIFSDKSPKEKQANLPAAKTKHLKKGDIGLPPIITDRCEMVEQQQGKETLYCRSQQLAPERGQGGYINRGGHEKLLR